MCALINEKQKIEDLGKKYIIYKMECRVHIKYGSEMSLGVAASKSSIRRMGPVYSLTGRRSRTRSESRDMQNGDPMSSSRDRMINWFIWRDRYSGVLKAVVYNAVRIVILSVSVSSQRRAGSQKILVG